MAVLSVWQPLVPLGNFGTVRCGQRLESTLVTRQLFSATCGSSKRHTAPCAISSALGRPSLLVQSATFWAMCGRSKWHTTPCAIWSAFGRLLFLGTLCPLGVSAPRICRVFAQKKVGIFDRWDMIG